MIHIDSYKIFSYGKTWKKGKEAKEETIQKYKDRYSTNWRIKLDETVMKMMDKLTVIREKE